ncbi:MAG TPA: hypothetical protein VMV82_05375 [Candidatus Dormibacteraeota bacterium]|nr:hypothetical protein [Candidatus Dormibacteraeota bacterium]
MSDENIHDEFALIADEYEFHPDFGRVPQSKGVPRSLIIAVGVGLIMIFSIAAGVILLSGYGHMWPSVTTLREPLK